MEQLLTILAPLVTQQNIAIIVLSLMVSACGWLHVVWRREDREERKGLHTVIESNTAATTELRITMAQISGKL